MSDCVEIPLRNGGVTYVSPEDAWVAQHQWWSLKSKTTSYALGRVDGRNVKLHRLILGAPADLAVDHKNRNGLDNRRANIRLCTRSQNQLNRRATTSKYGYRGIYYDPRCSAYFARFRFNRKSYTSPCCPTVEAAARAYDVLAKQYGGEFAALNFPEKVA